MRNTFGNPKIIDFTTKKFETNEAHNEALIERINAHLSKLKEELKKYHDWAEEARKLGDEDSAKHYEDEVAEFMIQITTGEELLTESLLGGIQLHKNEIDRLEKELANGEKEFRLEQIEDDIFRLQMDINCLEDDDEIPINEKQIKINELKIKIVNLESEKDKLTQQ